MMRPILIALLALAAPAAAAPPDAPAATYRYDMVPAGRETAWRIDRETGEVMVCRLDGGGLEGAAAATCRAAQIVQEGPRAVRIHRAQPSGQVSTDIEPRER